MAAELAGRVAIVTGAGRGIGRECAHLLAARGAAMAVVDIDADRAMSVAAEIGATGARVLHRQVDVADADAVRSMLSRCLAELGGLDILVNCAATLRPTPVRQISEAEWDRVVDVNLKGTFLVSQAALEPMIEAGYGRIVNLSSTAGKNVSTVGGAHYTASKAGVLGLTRHLATEVAVHGITVNAVCPGLIDTEMVRSAITPEQMRRYAEGFPIPRLGTAAEVAELVAFLASGRAAYITGAAFDITGGDLMI